MRYDGDMSFETQISGGSAAPLRGVLSCSDSGVFSVLSAIWLWLQALSRGVLGQGAAACEQGSNHVVSPANRELRARCARFANRPIPPARDHDVLRDLYGRGISRTQFLERLCRLSVDGRIRIYYFVYYSHRLTREAFMAIFTRGIFRAPQGLCDAHIAPD